jgi:hypothetical protein
MASAGQLRSSRQHGLSDTAIRKRAKANGWTRDLSGAGAPRAAAATMVITRLDGDGDGVPCEALC